jgi:hypothetical protein
MKLELITRIFDGVSSARKDGGAYLLPEETDVSIYISLPAEVLTLPRVSKVTTGAELLVVETFKGERFYFAPEDVAGIKLGTTREKDRGAGFGR